MTPGAKFDVTLFEICARCEENVTSPANLPEREWAWPHVVVWDMHMRRSKKYEIDNIGEIQKVHNLN